MVFLGIQGIVFSANSQLDYSKRVFPVGYDTSVAVFDQDCIFYKENKSGKLISKSIFPSTATFTKTTFRGKLDCRRIHFSNDVLFDSAAFNQKADFTRDTFNSVAIFNDARFIGESHFILANFQSYADFSGARFQGTSYFSNIGLTDTTIIDFSEAILPDTMDFSENPKIPGEINLSQASFSPKNGDNGQIRKHYLYLKGSDISKFKVDYLHFCLLFIDPKNNERMSGDEKEAIYKSLLQNFQNRGQLDSYKNLDIEFQDYEWNRRIVPLRWLYVVPHYWNLYGHENGLVFLWTVVLLLIFTFISYKYLDHLTKNVYPMKNIRDFRSSEEIVAIQDRKERIKQRWDRFWSAFVYTSTIFFLFSLNIDSFKFEYKKAAFFLIVVYTVGIICIAYMANFVIARS